MNWLIPRAICLPRLLLAILTVALLAGCATSGPTYSDLQSKLAAPAAGQGRIFIFVLTPLAWPCSPTSR